MKKWILMLGVSCAALLPFSLQADEEEVQGFRSEICVAGACVDMTQDFSDILGNEAFVSYMYRFFDRLADLLEDLNVKAEQLVALYPGEAVSEQWENEVASMKVFLDNRDELIKVMSFVGMGIYPENAYTDDETLPEFRKLQNIIFSSLLKCIVIGSEYDEEDIDDDVYCGRLAEVEQDVMAQTKELCLVSKDAFFSEKVSDFLGDASTRMEAIRNVFPSMDEEEECLGGESQAEMAFEDLEDEFTSKLLQLTNEMFSPNAIQELTEKIGFDEPEQQ